MAQETTPSLLSDLTACERQVWDALTTGDHAADKKLLSETFLGVYPDGFAQKADHVEQLAQGPTIQRYALDQMQARWLGSGHALLCYRATFTRSGRRQRERMYISSIWQRGSAGWINIFSQDTPADAT